MYDHTGRREEMPFAPLTYLLKDKLVWAARRGKVSDRHDIQFLIENEVLLQPFVLDVAEAFSLAGAETVEMAMRAHPSLRRLWVLV